MGVLHKSTLEITYVIYERTFHIIHESSAYSLQDYISIMQTQYNRNTPVIG